MGLFTLLVFCCVAGDHWVNGQDQLLTSGQEVLRYLQDLRNQVAGLQHRLEDQGKTLSMYALTRQKQERSIEELVERVSGQEKTIEEQAARLSHQERTIQEQDARLSHQERTIQEQDARLSHQERTIQEQDARLSHQERTIQEQDARLSHQERTIQEQDARLSHQERTIQEQDARLSHQERAIQEQDARLSHQERINRGQHQLMDEQRHEPFARAEEKYEADSTDEPRPAFAKRSDDGGPLEAKVDQVTQQVLEMSADLQALRNAEQARGTTYIRWGSAGCPASSELVYTGIVGGTNHRDTGGAGNHLCLTSNPNLDTHAQPSGNGYGYVQGSEYEICPEAGCNTTPACAVCRVARASTVMIPGTNTCTPGWTLEYSGYIMAGYNGYAGSSEFICVDSRHEHHASSSQANNNENTIYYTHTRCGALPCPPYVNDKILTCTVCSK